jgi:hypothetical protein
MQTTAGGQQTYRRAGIVRFEVDGVPTKVTLFASSDTQDLFLLFRDATSGRETYGAGRYLDVDCRTLGIESSWTLVQALSTRDTSSTPIPRSRIAPPGGCPQPMCTSLGKGFRHLRDPELVGQGHHDEWVCHGPYVVINTLHDGLKFRARISSMRHRET